VAQIPADILLRVRAEQAYKEIQKLEREIGKIDAAERKIPDAIAQKYVKLNGVLRQREKEVRDAGLAERVNTRELKKQTAELAKQQKARRRRRQDALLGGGFPLLFGAGPGQALAGLAGGAIGGFAGGIAAQAAVAGVAQLNDAITETAAVTTSTGAAYDFLTEKQLFSSDETRRLADELAELGRVEELAALATNELVQLIGNQGVQNLQALDSEWQELLSNLSELGLAIAGFISQYLKPVIELLNSVVGNINDTNRLNALTKENPDAAAFYDSIVEQRNKRGRLTQEGLSPSEARAQTLQKFEIKVDPKSNIPVTDADRDRFAPPKAKTKTGKSDEDRIRERLQLLAIETAAIREQAEIKRQISQARVAEDTARIEELQTALKMNQVQEQLAKTLVRTTDERVKQAEIFKSQTEAVAAQRAAEDKTAERLAQQTQNYQKNIDNLNLQIELASATTREQENQVKLELQLLQLRERNKDLMKEQPELMAKLEQKTRELFELQNMGPLQSYIKQTSAALADTEMQMTKIVQTVEGQLASGITNFFTGIIDGSKSAEQAFADMLKGMGQALIQQAAIMIAQYIAIGIARMFAGMPSMSDGTGIDISNVNPGTVNSLGGLGSIGGRYRANGGPVNNASPYIVGERGPELFVPNSSGTVINNEQSRAQLDMYSPGNAVDAPTGPMNVNMSYSGPTMAFDDKRYLPVEAVPGIIKDAAKQGEQRALSSMRNRVSTRNRVGI